MYSTRPHPHMAWMDLWLYSSELPMVLAGPFFGPVVACSLSPSQWTSLLQTYTLLPTALTFSAPFSTPRGDEPA